jgi:hypothetical protein
LLNRTADFIRTVGLTVSSARIDEPTFLPGLTVRDGVLLVDESQLLYPGDLLHEAGHLAVLPPSERASANAPFDGDGGLEMAAIAWSYSALRHLELDPALVFHEGGYKGGSKTFIENFAAKRYVGVPYLQWMGMTSEATFPAMSRWLR